MPDAALHECRNPRCGEYAYKYGFCRRHQPQASAPYRGPAGANLRPCNRRFRALRHAYLVRHPLCACCRHEPATELDHITPHRGDVRLFWDQTNWQGLCYRCHGRKTARETMNAGRGDALRV
jgi:5-methylcytosine-specific restriction protein A